MTAYRCLELPGFDRRGGDVRLRSLIRGLRGRLWALLAVAVAVALSAAFAALVATAWSASLPTGARSDLATSADDDIVISKPLVSVQDDAATSQTVDQVVAQDAPGVFTVEHTVASESYTLPGSTATAPLETYAVAEPSVMAHARLTAGAWPSATTVAGPHGHEVPVAIPGVTAEQLGLRVGSELTVGRSPTDPGVDFLIVGEFRYLNTGPDQAALAWNTIGPGGITYSDPPAVTYGPLAVAPAALTDGTLVPGSGNWTLLPAAAPDLSVLQHAAQAVTADQRLAPWKSFQMTTPLTGELALVSARVTAGRAELLAAGLLCGLLAGLALGAAAGNLVARGAAQAALMRSRGAPAWKLAAVYLPDTILVLLAAALGVLVQAPLASSTLLRITSAAPVASIAGGALGRSPSPADWVAGLAVACAAVGTVLVRAARVATPSELAAAAGRQSAVSGLARTGADLALVVLAGAAVWQASNTGLVAVGTGGGAGVVLIVACAPALATAAGAALCGRLVALGARVGERAAGRARSLPTRLAVWELARTPLRYLLPALLSVAAVAGCGYAAAQHYSWQRSVHDQASFQVGADVAVSLAQPQTLAPAKPLAGAPGTLAATPIYTSTPAQGPMIVGLDSHSAPQTVNLRADQADRPLPALWSAITPAAEPGFALPGRPIAVGIEARLAIAGFAGSDVTMTVEDASGIAYQADLGNLPADGATHTLQAVLAPSPAGIDYPLRIINVTLNYQLPAAVNGGSFTVAAVTTRDAGQQTAAPVAGAAAAIASWTPAIDWNPAAEPLNATEPSVLQWKPEAGRGAVADFASGAGAGPGAATALAITAGTSGAPLPAIATQAFLTAADEKVGAVVDASVDQISIPLRIVAAVRAFPAVTGASGQALIVDLGELSDQAALNYDPLGPVMTWWLRTADGATPPVLPVAAVAQNATEVQAGLTDDPLAAVPQRVLTLGAVALVLLALLGLLISLLAAARAAAARDSVLSALGMTRPQRAALGVVLHTCVAAPAAVLGVGLGFALARLLVPVFVLSPEANRPQPPPVVLFAAPWSLAAAAVVTGCTALAALAGSAARRNPSAASRTGD